MKKLVYATGLLLLSIASACAQGKPAFEGIVVYDMSFDESGLPPEVLSMLKGSTITVSVKGDMRRADTKTPMSTASTISDEKKKTVVSLMDMMGKKVMIRMGEKELKKESEKNPAPAIKYLDETKTIAGYICKKAEITFKNSDDKEETSTVFYTEELPSSDFRATYKGLKGFPMEYSMTQNGMKLTLTATKVSKEAIDDSKFIIPEGYKETTLEELQKSMGGE
jgi:GLPGLI family protein